MNDAQPSWIGRTIGGRYQIESLLGRGGMSSVYKATDPNLHRPVAVKIIHPHLSEHPEFVKRFEQEAAAVARLRHPNIIQVHDFNHDGDVYYMVLEYVPGETLESRLAALREADLLMPLSDTIRIVTKLCEALAYAHERKMVHRDVKPSNVILNLLGEPILMDFGIAKIVGGGHVHTATGATMGTAVYMSPEQVLGEPVDHRADIYSLGVMLYEMVAGKPPFEGKTAVTVMMKHVNEPVPDIRISNVNIPDGLAGVLEKALAKSPADRFQSTHEMALVLQQFLTPPDITPTQSFVGMPAPVPPSTPVPPA
ncbi:MAG: serine/threonine protein kinase, partial [Chloroflexi bacterium]